MSDHYILYRVPFLPPAVIISLPLAIFRPLNWPFSSVQNELQFGTRLQNLLKGGRLPGRKLHFIPQRRIENRGQPVNPIVGLRLPKAEQKTQHLLGRVQPEIHKDEEQLVLQGTQNRFPASASAPLARRIPPGIRFIQCLFVRLLESRK